MFENLEHFPINEKELLSLKNFINSHEKNIQANEKSVYCVDDFLDLLRLYLFFILDTIFNILNKS